MPRARWLAAALTAAPLLLLMSHTDPARAAGDKKEIAKMQLLSSYPVVVTDKLAECRDFYVQRLGFQVEFEATWFVYLASGSGAVAFMTPDHPSRPPGPERFGGQGLLLTLQVADAAAEFERLRKAGAKFAHPLHDEPWGQRRFGLVDPSGMWVDVVQQTEPAAGFWDRYMPAR
jgi:uncharacterized glyoxalase superfamily protein PhnB